MVRRLAVTGGGGRVQVAVAAVYQNADGDPAARAASKLAVREAVAREAA